ncbi:putative quinol monooxygenase [Sphingomonas sp.]
MIGVIMHVRTKAGKAETFAALAAQLQRDVLANEPDTLIFSVMRAADDPELFVFTELFANEAAWAAHPDMPYHKAMSAAGWDCVEGEPLILKAAPLTPGSTGINKGDTT